MPRIEILLALTATALAVQPAAAQERQGADAVGEVETGAQPEPQSDDARISEEPDAGGPAGADVDPGPFAFFDPGGGMDVAEGACGEEAAAWLNTTMMDLDGTWTMELGPPSGNGPLAGAGSDTVLIQGDASARMITIGGAAFASEVPLEVWQGGEVPFAELPGEADVTSDRAASALGCPFERLPRLTARGALAADNGAAPFLLVVAVPNARTLAGVLQTGEGDDASTRLVRLTR
jgi:hypothetical protein